MSEIARISLYNGKKSASVHELARTGGTGPRTDSNGRERRNDWALLERLEAENLELRSEPSNSRSRFKPCAMLADRRSGRLGLACANRQWYVLPADPAPFRVSHRGDGRKDRHDPAVIVVVLGAGLMIACASALPTIVK